MRIQPCALPGVYEITPTPRSDHRGYFMRTYDRKIWADHGLDRQWVQENESFSQRKGTIRGLHLQLPPYAETKLVRVTKGAIFDVFVDLRADSATFGQWGSIELTADNRKMVYIPSGFAHGFCTLADDCAVAYKVDNFYTPAYEGGVIWNDGTLGIAWPLEGEPVISSKDSLLPSLQMFTRMHQHRDLKG
ncbi:dTDP-4-dehydrorhamnose 3,5-epimerase [Paenibacillus hodogayensis]|uniref:dTDP-4-dehydrorhamnose 3,5-epimerase n=1 Tax=Paenibacillus hodogayensis TaxID=279208 RepID=A0ABV5W2Y8_9BACL